METPSLIGEVIINYDLVLPMADRTYYGNESSVTAISAEEVIQWLEWSVIGVGDDGRYWMITRDSDP